jgi:energy-coupling factor transport system substrate-specific component
LAEKKTESGGEVKVIPTGARVLAVVMIPTIAALNYVGGVIVELLKAPIWGDTWATMLGTLISGFWVGSIGGLLYNIIMAFSALGPPQLGLGFCQRSHSWNHDGLS